MKKKTSDPAPFDLDAARAAWQRHMDSCPVPPRPSFDDLQRREYAWREQQLVRRQRQLRRVAAVAALFVLSGSSYAVAQQQTPDARMAVGSPSHMHQSFLVAQEIVDSI